ncbi:hypothetical protein DL769_007275 [Monosporascus sp. CRB-8-3]|nr:hypothetical protein DL769_007275 [Monosporascus sp. CRB-8-3]
MQKKHPLGMGEPWSAVSLALAPGTPADIALFSITTPYQYCWRMALRSPPVLADLPQPDMDGPPFDLFQPSRRPARFQAAHGACYERALVYWPPEMTPRVEAMRTPPSPGYVNLFPELQAALDAGTFRPGHAQALTDLNDIGGYVFLTGGPGSGKSTFAIQICRALMSRGRQVVCLAPSNALVNDPIQKLSSIAPSKKIRCMLPWEEEMHNLTSSKPTDSSEGRTCTKKRP